MLSIEVFTRPRIEIFSYWKQFEKFCFSFVRKTGNNALFSKLKLFKIVRSLLDTFSFSMFEKRMKFEKNKEDFSIILHLSWN